MKGKLVGAGETLDVTRIPAGTARWYEVVVTSADGGVSEAVPVLVLAGTWQRPCLALVAGVHGDEYDGIRACQELAHELDPTRLLGTLVIVPVANPFAFAAAQRRTPHDDVDLNRVFPGRLDGSLSERLAYRLTFDILHQADFIFTMHGAMADGVLTPWIEFLNEPGPVGQAAFAAAGASGFPDLVGLPQELPGRLLTAFAARGVPVIEGEVGGRGQLRRENVATYKQRALAVAGYLGILPNPSAAAGERPAVWSLAERPVLAPVTGLFEPDVSLKQLVRAGTRVGQILDARGDRSAEFRTETDAVVAGYRDHAGVQKGDTLVTLWVPATARVNPAT
jgi:predicted deacylase